MFSEPSDSQPTCSNWCLLGALPVHDHHGDRQPKAARGAPGLMQTLHPGGFVADRAPAAGLGQWFSLLGVK